jgi:hypothetical protein
VVVLLGGGEKSYSLLLTTDDGHHGLHLCGFGSFGFVGWLVDNFLFSLKLMLTLEGNVS